MQQNKSIAKRGWFPRRSAGRRGQSQTYQESVASLDQLQAFVERYGVLEKKSRGRVTRHAKARKNTCVNMQKRPASHSLRGALVRFAFWSAMAKTSP